MGRKIGVICYLLALMGMIGVSAAQAVESQIVFYTWKSNQPHLWERLIQGFHRKHPDLQVRIQVGPHSSTAYHAVVTQKLKNRDPSLDVFLMDVVWPPEFANAGWALDLTDRFPEREKDQFLKGPIDANTYGGGIYGVPCYVAAGLFYYRKDLLQDRGLECPTTWEDMLAYGEIISQARGASRIHIHTGQFKQYEGLVCNMLEFVRSNGARIIDRRGRKALLEDPRVVASVRFVRDRIIGEATPRGAVNHEEPESLSVFVQGQSVFHRNWPYAWAVVNASHRSKIAGRVGIGSLPAFPKGRSSSTLGGWQLGISRWSRQPGPSWRLVRYLTSYETQKILALEAGLAPARRAVYNDGEVQERMPHLSDFLPVFETARPRPLSPVYPMLSQELQRFFSRAIVDPNSPIDQLARATSRRLEKILHLSGPRGK